MMFTIVGCSFRRFIASKSKILNVRLFLQPPSRKQPPLPVRLTLSRPQANIAAMRASR